MVNFVNELSVIYYGLGVWDRPRVVRCVLLHNTSVTCLIWGYTMCVFVCRYLFINLGKRDSFKRFRSEAYIKNFSAICIEHRASISSMNISAIAKKRLCNLAFFIILFCLFRLVFLTGFQKEEVLYSPVYCFFLYICYAICPSILDRFSKF